MPSSDNLPEFNVKINNSGLYRLWFKELFKNDERILKRCTKTKLVQKLRRWENNLKIRVRQFMSETIFLNSKNDIFIQASYSLLLSNMEILLG